MSRNKSGNRGARRSKPGTVRIIGGRWRGRRLAVPDLPGLRPSGDRGRETLFNWLAPRLHGARCLDLFAGTGVLGFEAASRGAASVVMVEKAAPAVAAMRENLALLTSAEPGRDLTVVQADALSWLEGCGPGGLDIVFIDPPFGAGLEGAALDRLVRGGCLAEGAVVYLETARGGEETRTGSGWEVLRDKAIGEVRMRLLRRI